MYKLTRTSFFAVMLLCSYSFIQSGDVSSGAEMKPAPFSEVVAKSAADTAPACASACPEASKGAAECAKAVASSGSSCAVGAVKAVGSEVAKSAGDAAKVAAPVVAVAAPSRLASAWTAFKATKGGQWALWGYDKSWGERTKWQRVGIAAALASAAVIKNLHTRTTKNTTDGSSTKTVWLSIPFTGGYYTLYTRTTK